jgi:hypothetical protein
MTTNPRDTVILTTPGGHEVVADLDYENFEVRRAKVVHSYTGVIKPLDEKTAENLARALKAKQVYEQALGESKAVEQTLKGFGEAVAALGKKHPALAPYWKEAEQHHSIAQDMRERAKHFHDDAMRAIDKLVGD